MYVHVSRRLSMFCIQIKFNVTCNNLSQYYINKFTGAKYYCTPFKKKKYLLVLNNTHIFTLF